jgi:hypothetical protein
VSNDDFPELDRYSEAIAEAVVKRLNSLSPEIASMLGKNGFQHRVALYGYANPANPVVVNMVWDPVGAFTIEFQGANGQIWDRFVLTKRE